MLGTSHCAVLLAQAHSAVPICRLRAAAVPPSGSPCSAPCTNTCLPASPAAPQFPEIVVSVARKTDAALWPALFAAVGSPLRLCQGLMQADQLQASAVCPAWQGWPPHVAACCSCWDATAGGRQPRRFARQLCHPSARPKQPF